MPLPPGHSLSGSRIFFASGGSGGGSDAGAPLFIGSAPPSGQELSYYGGQINASGLRPITFTVTSGALPTGTTLNASTGLISGASPTAGIYTFTIKAENSLGSATQEFTVFINGRAPLFQYPYTNGTPPGDSFAGVPELQYYRTSNVLYVTNVGTVGTWADFAPIGLYTGANLGSAPITWSVTGTVPDGMVIDPDTGIFTTPTAPAFGIAYQFYVTASNAYGSLTRGWVLYLLDL